MIRVSQVIGVSPIAYHFSLTFADFDLQHFWNWTQFRDYCQFILCISVVGFGVTYLLRNVTIFIELLGFASLMTEAMLGVPQFWKNFKNKSVQGMR